MESDTQRLTKLHVKEGNDCSFKIYQPIYINVKGCKRWVDDFLWQKSISTPPFQNQIQANFNILRLIKAWCG